MGPRNRQAVMRHNMRHIYTAYAPYYGCRMAHNEFTPYRVTENTARRPPGGFEPSFADSRALQERLRRIERLDQQLSIYEGALTTSHLRLRQALAINSHGTASIEGNPLSLDEVESLLERAPNMVDVQADEREILNWVAFMEDLDEHQFPRRLDGIKDLHATLMKGVLPDAGSFKEGQNFIGTRSGEVVFIPSPAEAVPSELAVALEWLHASPLHPILRASLFFMEYQGIHPFRDGNGRTGRALFTWYLHQEGYRGIRYALIDAAFNKDRPPYYGTLHEVETNGYDYTPWIEYLTEIMETAYRDAVAAMELDRDHPSLNDRQRDVVAWFRRITTANPQRRVKFADVHAAFPHIAPRSLQRDLAGLVELHLVQRDGERRGATYWIDPSNR